MVRHFEPIAIVGRSCILPGVSSPEDLWNAVHAGRDLVSTVPAGRWGLSHTTAMTSDPSQSADRAWSDRGGYVTDYEEVIAGLDPVFQWALAGGRNALRDAGHDGSSDRVGAIMGNLSFPSSAMSRFAESVWLDAQDHLAGGRARSLAGVAKPDPQNRFMSGLPAHLLAKELGLGAGAFALDAACASSLYAIKLACDKLHDRDADLMLAGAVCRSDDLFIHVGFCALQAMSKTGQTRPFHAGADGLVPAEGSAFVALKRLSDAITAGDRIYGVIRGVGLSNDGRGKGLLAPSSEGQIRAIRAAYAGSDLNPSDVSLVECHATGTVVGDAAEIKSMAEVFAGHPDLPIGSLKSNMGHAITAAGAAGLLKVLGAMEAEIRPPTLHIDELNPVLASSPCRPLAAAEPWNVDRRVAGVSAFGFGGNNAHVVVEQYDGPSSNHGAPAAKPTGDIAIVGLGTLVADGRNRGDFASHLFGASSRIRNGQGRATDISMPLSGLRFPPADLQQTLPQQLLVLRAALEAVADAPALPQQTTMVLIGSGSDPEVARYGARWRLAEWAQNWAEAAGAEADASWIAGARDAIVDVLKSAGVVGNMPNIPANRLNSQFDVAGPSFTVSSEELSGIVGLNIACRALRAGEVDAAMVGAVDLSCEPVHIAASAILGPDRQIPGDAAVVLVLKRADEARAAGDRILAILPDEPLETEVRLGFGEGHVNLSERFGHSHAASGLVHVAAAALCCFHQLRPGSSTPWNPVGPRAITVNIDALGGQRAAVAVAEHDSTRTAAPLAATTQTEGPAMSFPGHPDDIRIPGLNPAAEEVPEGTQRMAPPPAIPSVFHDAPSALSGPTGFEPGAVAPSIPAPAPAPAAPIPVTAPSPIAAAPQFAAPLVAPAPPVATVVTPRTSHPITGFHGELAQLHADFLNRQAEVHRRFLNVRQNALTTLMQAYQARGQAPVIQAPVIQAPAIQPRVIQPPAPAPFTPSGPPSPPTASVPAPVPAPAPQPPAPTAKPTTPEPVSASPTLPGPKYSREQLEILASGKISSVLGPLFSIQDDFPRQVRMPEPPLLLADRVTGIDAEPGSMTTGTIWTESDITADRWYMHDGAIPAGILIESGQADLLLISWLGADFQNKGERVYRLLGCQLTYRRGLPVPGETLKYEIHIDGHANHGAVRIFFFHYDCQVNGENRLEVREGQAGFFTDEELANSNGILWTPADEDAYDPGARLDPPRIACTRSSFTREQIEAFAAGDAYNCFGPGFEYLAPHTRTPRISPAPMLWFDEITDFDTKGGPWGRGYMCATQDFSPDDWFFDGHFKDDPCMPGTLMFEATLQMIAFYMAGCGFTVDKDGWRFEPVPDMPYDLRCRGQAIPSSKQAVYEIFVEKVVDGDKIQVFADVLVTVDGLKAFHAHHVGVELVYDWPLSSLPEILDGYEDPVPVATKEGFPYGFASLMSCAWGKPSDAFGPFYAPFDGGRHCARLPGPPYHFMTRLVRIDGDPGAMTIGTEIELEYDIPEDSWYFDENGNRSMPFAVLLEAALQPCGWIACYIGSALTTDEDLYFRNLDGTGTQKAELFDHAGTLRTISRIKSVSNAGGMIIESFDVKCYLGDVEVYEMNTVFGFFPTESLAQQVGITPTQDERDALHAPSDFLVDLTERPVKYCGGELRLPKPMLLMLDRVSGYWPEGGSKGLGKLRSEKDVNPEEWFFKAHFFTDPVQPGSLGIEAMIQLLQFYMLHNDMGEGIDNPRFEAIQLDAPMTWKYRGQVVPRNDTIRCELEITEVGSDERGPYAVCSAYLWVDELRIYQAVNMGMRIVSGPAPDSRELPERAEKGPEILDPETSPWLADHCPTWTIPALPAMSMVDRLAAGVSDRVVGVEDLQVHRWIPIPGPTKLATELADLPDGSIDAKLLVWRDARNEALSRFEPAASGRIITGDWPAEPPALGPIETSPAESPYQTGSLFHGPAFQYLKSIRFGSSGSTAILDAGAGSVPFGALNQGLLDAVTHAIPHDDLARWSEEIGADLCAYPWRIESLQFFRNPPTSGEVRVEARFDGFAAERQPRFHLQAFAGDAMWLDLKLVEILLPKGPIGSAQPQRRLAFLKDRQPADGLGLSETTDGVTTLRSADIATSDWLPGTVARVYGIEEGDLLPQIAVADHVGRLAEVHPSTVSFANGLATTSALPLTRWPVTVSVDDATATVRSEGEPRFDITPISTYWDSYFQMGQRWPVEDIYYGLISRFVRRVHVENPEALAAFNGRSILFVGNHQIGFESLALSILASGLTGTNTVTLAKMEHKVTWLGRLISHCFSYPGCNDPEVITFFDRANKRSLPKIIGELAEEMAGPGKSVMVHVEGTRSLECRSPVKLMSGAFIDMAINTDSPLVPIRFTGALPVEKMEKRIEFPIGMGQQDIWIGEPMQPAELKAIPLRERKQLVVNAINGLGPSNEIEEPLPSDPEYAARVRATMAEFGTTEEHATILTVLRDLENPGLETRKILDAAAGGDWDPGDGEKGEWMAEIGRRLLGR